MTKKFGLVSYEDVELSKPITNSGGKDEFMIFEQGDNEVRLLTDPFQYSMHRYKAPGDKGIGDRVKCSLWHGSCPLCELRGPDGKQLYPPKDRWYVWAIDRKTGSEKIIDMSSSIFRKLKAFNANPKIGDPKLYDINIVVNKNATPNEYYNVQSYNKEPLSEEDVRIKKNINIDSLKDRCVPPSPEQVLDRMKRIEAKFSNKQDVQVQQTVQTEEVSSSDSSDDDEFSFPVAQV